MFKAFGFIKRNSNLTHDEYRAGHAGYHNSFGRRLNNIRGYILNVRSNNDLACDYQGSSLIDQITIAEPRDFDNAWDGYGQLNFDSVDDYFDARTPAFDRAGKNGLEYDPMVAKVGNDLEYLYSGSPFQFCVDESVQLPVIRPEKKLFKVVQFVKRPHDLPAVLFRSYLAGKYCSAVSNIQGMRGLILNLRTSLDIMNGFFTPESEGFTVSGVNRRELFYSLWDGIVEYWFEDADSFFAHRTDSQLNSYLHRLESELFAASFYREVDETVAVIPNRNQPDNFYHR